MIERYISYLSSIRRYSQRTCDIYRSVLESYYDFTDSLDATQVRNYEVYLMDDKAMDSRTVHLHLSVLSGYCRFLIKEGLMQSNPVRLVSRPKLNKRLPVFYREEALRLWYEQSRGVLEYGNYEKMLRHMIVSLLYNTGIRRSELISLNLNSFDPYRKVLKIKGKGDKCREIPLGPFICEEISLFLQKAGSLIDCENDPQEPLLKTPKGRRLYPVWVDRAVKAELGKVDLISGRKSAHVLRHTLATELLDDGAELNSIKELLGHSSLAATQVYTHNSLERLRNVYQNAHPRAKNGK